MNQDLHHSYTAEEIRCYLQGEMSEAEMHALEKAALDDPMLADAIEGFQASLSAHGERKTMQDVEALNRAFAARFHQTPVRRFPWQVAAAATVIIVAGIVTFNYFNKPTEKLAIMVTDTSKQTNPVNESTAQVPDTTVAKDATARQPSTAPVKQRSVVTSEDIALNKKPVDDNQGAAVELSPRQENDEPPVENSKRTDSVPFTARDVAAPQATRGVTAGTDKTEVQNNAMHLIRGRVLNSNMEPLANASLVPSNTALQQNNSNNRLNTDNSGYFNVLSPDTSLIVKVTAAGYEEQLFRLRNSPSQNNLVLRNQFKGKAAGVPSEKKSTEERATLAQQQASPEGGWSAFDTYVEKNKIYPAENSNLTGEVIVSFQVNNQGKLSNFKVLQSLAKGYDEEAIRLIREGPKWKVLKGRRASVTVNVRF